MHLPTSQLSVPRVIIDTDPGIDDAAAILFALGLEKLNRLELLALTTVCGNVPLELTQKNARLVCDWAERFDVSVYAGAEAPFLNDVAHAEEVHGHTGLEEMAALVEPKTPLQPVLALEFLIETLESAPERSITLCALGPLTNIGLVLKFRPSCAKGIKEIVVMGGTYLEPGNITPNAEFNFFVDPIAARIVLESKVPLCILPLDVTHRACVTTPRMDRLRILANTNGRRIADLLQSYSRYDIQQFGLEGGALHDPCPVAYLVEPDLFTSKPVFATIEVNQGLMQGAVQVDWYQRLGHLPNVKWVYDLKADAFFELFTLALSELI
ncbi:MAG: nucleoside hydrolase [Neisseriaceae bacterium]